MTIAIIALLIFLPMLFEAGRAARNERAQRSRGGVEAGDDVYNLMRVAYPASFLAMLGEGAMRGTPDAVWLAVGFAIFGAAKAIKWWAILSLDRSWTFRVVVVAGDPLVVRGPYRYLRHPNYVGVVGELVGVALVTKAMIAGPLVLVVFAALLFKRIAVEEQALKSLFRGL